MSLSWQWQRYKREGPNAKTQLCFMSAKIPLAKANFIVDPEVKGWASTSLIHAYTGELQNHMGEGVDIGRRKITVPQIVIYLHCSENISGSALPLAWYSRISFLCLSL